MIEKWGRNGSETVPLEGVKFEVKYANGQYVDAAGGTLSSNGLYYTDSTGKIILSGITGTVVVTELESVEGYTIDPDGQSQTVTINPNDTQTLRFYNNAVGGVEFLKVSEADKTERIPNTTFEIRRVSNDALINTVTTGRDGKVYLPLESGDYYAVETESAEGFKLDDTPICFTVKDGQTTRKTVTNAPLSGIANNSTTSLTSFYWRDTLSVEAVRLTKITTGTYNAAGNYKIVYKTNLSGSEYRVLADSLNTQQNYVLDASPVALRLGSNEYVTEVMFVFGVVPSNFRQVETPMIDCSVVSWVKGGSQFVNQADVGGVYDGQWIMATSRWVTKVYAPSKPLPRTGY